MIRQNINRGWMFYGAANGIDSLDNAPFIGVNLPHTWNNLDGQDGGSDYFRGKCYYKKLIDLDKKDDKDYYLEFMGVNSIAYVYVNNVLVGEHKGGYSTFRFNVTSVITRGENAVIVAVDNSADDGIYPQMADFTFFGGIYRDVNVIEVNTSRFDLDYYGGDGVMVTPIVNKDSSADVVVRPYITNAKVNGRISADIYLEGKLLVSQSTSKLTDPVLTFHIDHPVLWDGVENPVLYKLNISLYDGPDILDSRELNFGIRSFEVTADGFFMNGRKYDLHGVSRHQDRLNKGWAISRDDHVEDMRLIREMGANSIRLAHYQHDQYFYELCDRYGMVVWAEIPYISIHLEAGDDNAMSQMRELVIQNYNHPSIMFWGLSNEITIGGESDAQLALHKRLNELVKSLDNTRLTTMANVTMCSTDSPLLDVPDIFAYNHYFGWYVGKVEDNADWIDGFRAKYPNKPLAISEYGAEANTELHTSNPSVGDYTEEYQAYYHEKMLEIFEARPYLFATYVWNMFDFAVDARDEGGVKGRNNKGLVTYDRKILKDSYYIYKAHWLKEPFVHICSRRYDKRAEEYTTIKVYSNAAKVDLYAGDKLIESQSGRYVFTFSVKLSILGTTIRAVADGTSDSIKIRRVLSPVKSYMLKDDNNVANWFMKDGVKYEFKFIEGKLSIRDTFDEIYSHDAGKAILDALMDEMRQSLGQGGETRAFVENMRKLIGGMSIEKIARLGGKKVDDEMLYAINERLNKIDK